MAGESKLQKNCKKLAESYNIIAVKVEVANEDGWPDLLLIFPHTGEHVWVEMKNPNKKGRLAKRQRNVASELDDRDVPVYKCDDFDEFKKIVFTHLKRKN